MIAATIDHNRGPALDDELPPKGKRIVDRDRADQILLAARMISALYRTPKNRIMEKRKGGEDGRSLRRFLILYARGIGCPVWECAKIFDLNRKQIGQEEGEYLDMLATNPELEEDVDNMTSMLDFAAKVQCARFIRVSIAEIQAAAAVKKALQTIRAAAGTLEPPPKPKPKPKTESERIRDVANAKHMAEARARSERLLRRIIEEGAKPSATKEQRKDADKALRGLKELLASKPAKA